MKSDIDDSNGSKVASDDSFLLRQVKVDWPAFDVALPTAATITLPVEQMSDCHAPFFCALYCPSLILDIEAFSAKTMLS